MLECGWTNAAGQAESPVMAASTDITRLLTAWSAGDRQALDELTPIVYEELRRLAESYMRKESGGHTLQATALVHEAYGRLASADIPLRNRAHFLAFMARLMRQVLVDHARSRKSAKRGDGYQRVTLDESLIVSEDSDGLVLELDQVLEELREFDDLKSRIIEMRFFGGLTYDEAAAALGISASTLDRELRLAKAWLRHRMRQP
jgi:RNA polymerase sigma factor (TIGR02999 family)